MTRDDLLGFSAGRARACLWASALVVCVVAVMIAGLILGPTMVPLRDVYSVLSHHLTSSPLHGELATADSVVWDIRLPRIILGVVVGAALAVAGVVLQAVVGNVLADPYILGINSGASAGAALAILFGVGAGVFGGVAVQGMSFAGAMAASVLMFGLARSSGRLSSVRLLMGGIAVGYALSALTSFLVFASDSAQGSRSVLFWLLGSLALAQWAPVLWVTIIVTALCCAILWWQGVRIDALSVGDDAARTLGINPDRTRLALVIVTCVLVGATVAMAGSIGFVGLIVPHVARRLVGGTHRYVIVVSGLIGAALMVAADVLSRLILAPQEIPIGIITAFIGAPFLILLVIKAGESS